MYGGAFTPHTPLSIVNLRTTQFVGGVGHFVPPPYKENTDKISDMSDTLRVSNLHFGLNTSNYNQPQIGFTSVGIGSTANYGFLQFLGTSNTLCWTANGTVGIGTSSPVALLDVNGSFRVLNRASIALTSGTGVDIIYSGGGQLSSGTRGVGGALTAATMGYYASTHTFYADASASTNALTINTSGQVGIGTSPSQKLDVNGTIKATGFNLSGYNLLTPKMIYVGSQLLTGAYNGTTGSNGVATFPIIIGAYNEGTISGAFRSGSNPDTSQYFKAYYITCQINNSNSCEIGVAINNTILASGVTWSSTSFKTILQSGYFLKWTQFPTQGAYGYSGSGLNLQIYQANTAITYFEVNYITVHCVYLHTSYTNYPTVSGLTYNSTYQDFT